MKMADLELEKKLEDNFEEFCIDVKGNLPVLEKLCRLCQSYNLEPEDIVAEWVSFTVNKNNDHGITPEALHELEKKRLLKSASKHSSAKKSKSAYRPNIYNATTISQINTEDVDDEEEMLGSYATTPQTKASLKRLHTTPDEPVNKRIASMNSTPVTFSPASHSPAIVTPSAKYEARSGKGELVATYGISDKTGIEWKGCARTIFVKNFDNECNVQKSYKFMFQKLQDKADVLNDMITSLTHQMKHNLMLDDFESVAIKNQEDITVAGRICCDSVGRMNSKSIVLEGSRESSLGTRIPLDLTEVKNYSLFPGQIVAMQGKNMSGSKIFPNSIYNGNRLPFFCANKKDSTIDEGHFTTYITCGPYATCDTTLSYTPLEDLLKTIESEAPDVLIMLGPFVDSKQHLIEKGDVDETFDDYFIYCCQKVEATVRNLQTTVIFVPSQRDVFHDFVYPQPPFDEHSSEKIKMMSDPCTIMINDVCFGVTSTDILFHLGAEEVSAFAVRSDRLGRLADHLLLQQCYYPLHPTSEDVNLNYEHFERHCFMPVTPDVLVVPSDLRYFVKDVSGCLAVNPGRLVKGQTGGTFLKLLVKPKKPPNTNKSSVVGHSIAQIVRI